MSILGKVVDRRAILPVTFRIPGMGDIQIDCVVDTGFSGPLTFPEAAINSMGLTFLDNLPVNLANDALVEVSVYAATIVWDGVERTVRVLASGRKPLIGVALIYDHLLGIDFIENGIVTARPRS